MASAAPADLYEPVGTMPVVGDVVQSTDEKYTGLRTSGVHTVSKVRDSSPEICLAGYLQALARWFQTGAVRIIKRQATQAQEFQVWRSSGWTYIVDGQMSSVAYRRQSGEWCMGSGNQLCFSEDSPRLVGPEAEKAIAEAKAQGVLS